MKLVNLLYYNDNIVYKIYSYTPTYNFTFSVTLKLKVVTITHSDCGIIVLI